MNQQKQFAGSVHKSPNSFTYGYLCMNIAFALVLPIVSIFIDYKYEGLRVNWELIGKWGIFWAVGMRLFLAGLKQASSPEYMAVNIFKMKSRESYIVIRELGFANIALGSMGILSVLNEHWRMIAAITGGIFLGFAALQHGMKKLAGTNELIALIYDTLVFFGLVAYLLFH